MVCMTDEDFLKYFCRIANNFFIYCWLVYTSKALKFSNLDHVLCINCRNKCFINKKTDFSNYFAIIGE